MIIFVDGNIGVGKSTLISNLRDYYTEKGHTVKVLDEILPDMSEFYEWLVDPNSSYNAYEFEVKLLSTRLYQLMHAVASTIESDIVLVDRSHFGNAAFMLVLHHMGRFDNHQLDAYIDTMQNIDTNVRISTYSTHALMYINLVASTDVLLNRIYKRGRPEEANITKDYLSMVDAAYDEIIEIFNKRTTSIRSYSLKLGNNYEVIDANKTPLVVMKTVVDKINQYVDKMGLPKLE